MGAVDEGLMDYLTVVTGVLVLLLFAVCWGLSLLSLIGGRLYLHVKSDPLQMGDDIPGVSIVKPITGMDAQLEANLESHFTLTYPKFELLFCFHDEQDPAINLVKQLQVKYPKVPVRLFWHSRNGIPNPLVRNLTQGYDAAVYDYVWVCSSKVPVSREVVEDMVVKLSPPDVALVHQLPFCGPHLSPLTAAIVQQIYFGSALARYYLSFNCLSACCVAGLSYVVKKSVLDGQQCPGMAHYGRYVFYDFHLTKHLHQRGYKLVMSAFPAQQNVSGTSLNSFVERMVRWSRLRLHTLTLVAGVLEPLSECLPLGLLTSYFLFQFFGIRPLIFMSCHLPAWIIVDYLLLTLVQNGPLRINIFRFLYCWLLRQVLSVWIYVRAVCNPRQIRWATHSCYVHSGGLVHKEYNV